MAEDDLTVYYVNKIFTTLTLAATAQLTPNRKSYQLSEPEIEINVMEDMYAALHMYRKDDILRQRRLNHSGRGEGDYGTQSHAVEPDRWADRQMGSWAGWHLERWVDRCAAGEHAGRQGGAGS